MKTKHSFNKYIGIQTFRKYDLPGRILVVGTCSHMIPSLGIPMVVWTSVVEIAVRVSVEDEAVALSRHLEYDINA